MDVKLILPAILVLVLCRQNLKAQTTAQRAFSLAWKITNNSPENYLTPVLMLDSINADQSDKAGVSILNQARATYYSFIGNYRQSLYYTDNAPQRLIAGKQFVNSKFTRTHSFIDASKYLIKKSAVNKVIMINEAHYLPYHRAFVLTILKDFYKNGYRYLAIETLDDTLINTKKYPDYNTGTYSSEPIFGEMIREAIKLKFKLIPYESHINCDNRVASPMYCNSFRDSIMAINLSKALNNDPSAKMLVYAGYDHIQEGNEDGWEKMAEYFKKITGIDPFTIDLTQQIEHFDPQREQEEFVAVNEIKHISSPVVALQNGEAWHGKFVDATVIFPRYISKKGRPSFYSIKGRRKPYHLAKLGLVAGQLVQAFYESEKPGMRIPADQIIITNNNDFLNLFKGRYELEVKGSNGLLIRKMEINL